jgi:hypothetical protein
MGSHPFAQLRFHALETVGGHAIIVHHGYPLNAGGFAWLSTVRLMP